jgi:hypothetical protein
MSEKEPAQEKHPPDPGEPEYVYRPGLDPEADAWYTAFFIENHIDYQVYPEHVAAPEQVRFMVWVDEKERYYPCSDRMFGTIMMKSRAPFLQEKYETVLQRMLRLIQRQIEEPRERDYLTSLIRTKYLHDTRDNMMIPSRIEKRLLKIYLDWTKIEDPHLCEKAQRNIRAARILDSAEFKDALDHADSSSFDSPPASLARIREYVEYLKLRRLLGLSMERGLWESDEPPAYVKEDFLRLFERPLTGNGVDPLWEFLGLRNQGNGSGKRPRKILWLADEAGEVMVDLAIIRCLVDSGHKVIIAFKEGPMFTKVDFFDVQVDEQLRSELEGAPMIDKKDLAKNELVDILKKDIPLMAVSDGTRENLNLLLVSTTFSRIFKEVDGVISRGPDQRRRFFESHFRFTQDIFSIAMDQEGHPSILHKAAHPSVIKFSVSDLEDKAYRIILEMEGAKAKGMSVMFYSGIIGSIPGKEAVAMKVMSTYVEHIKEQAPRTHIINPSEYSEPGMDADDLMFMWEIVQRSGMIDIWRFQTYDDIVRAFQKMGTKIPPEWVGKDATFSTGCTKEMKIALDVQKDHPEMQIIGPSQEKFLRRREYGVGKMYDSRLDELCQA